MELNKDILEKLLNDKKQSIIMIIIVVVIIILAIYFGLKDFSNYETIESLEDLENNEDFSNQVISNIEQEEKIKVYITGEVNSPGVFELSYGSRIEDAISIAGGITDMANLEKVNLAYKLEDGQKIYIPNRNDKEEIPVLSTENGENVVKGEANNAGKININSADETKLCEIPGIGKTFAKRIVDYRKQNGKFKTLEELKNVSGIGEKKFEAIKEYIEIK